jgi:hypothetical protein
MNLRKGIIITLVVVVLGLAWLYLAMVGPLQSLNIGFGLASGLAATKLPGGYNMANVVLFIIFLIVLGVLGIYFMNSKKTR